MKLYKATNGWNADEIIIIAENENDAKLHASAKFYANNLSYTMLHPDKYHTDITIKLLCVDTSSEYISEIIEYEG